jgi:hypothetical protein
VTAQEPPEDIGHALLRVCITKVTHPAIQHLPLAPTIYLAGFPTLRPLVPGCVPPTAIPTLLTLVGSVRSLSPCRLLSLSI